MANKLLSTNLEPKWQSLQPRNFTKDDHRWNIFSNFLNLKGEQKIWPKQGLFSEWESSENQFSQPKKVDKNFKKFLNIKPPLPRENLRSSPDFIPPSSKKNLVVGFLHNKRLLIQFISAKFVANLKSMLGIEHLWIPSRLNPEEATWD